MSKLAAMCLWILGVVACAAPPAVVDPGAREILGRVVNRIELPASSRTPTDPMLDVIGGMYGVMGYMVARGLAMAESDARPYYLYVIQLSDGREVRISKPQVLETNNVGDCVRVFESSQRGYPRMAGDTGCLN